MNELQNVAFEYVGHEKEFGFQLVEMKDMFHKSSWKSGNPFTPHRIDFYTLLILTEDKMTHEVDFVEYEMNEGDCLFISKGQIHKFDDSKTYNGYGLVFTEDYMLRHISLSAFTKISFLYNYHLNPSKFRDFGDREILIKAITRELSLDLGEVKADVVASILTVFLLKAQAHTVNHLNSVREEYEQFLQFQQLVVEKYRDTRMAKQYAFFLNITLRQLNKLCDLFTGKSAKEYINSYIVLEIKRQLATTSLPIKQIAYECGFSEVTNFLKYFKKYTQTTPSKFRALKR
ncbi:MAG: helix-turn-helix transcriptional regulator [Bacteroidota bacterium]